jgi:hypothetical protein
MKHPKFILKKSEDDQFYFVLTSKNGKVLVTSETYKKRLGALNGIQSVCYSAQILSAKSIENAVDDQTK